MDFASFGFGSMGLTVAVRFDRVGAVWKAANAFEPASFRIAVACVRCFGWDLCRECIIIIIILAEGALHKLRPLTFLDLHFDCIVFRLRQFKDGFLRSRQQTRPLREEEEEEEGEYT